LRLADRCFLGARADDKDKDTTCPDRTIEGDYASAADGVILPALGLPLLVRGINMVHNDDKGHSPQVDSLILNGAPIQPLDSRDRHLLYSTRICAGTGTLFPSTRFALRMTLGHSLPLLDTIPPEGKLNG